MGLSLNLNRNIGTQHITAHTDEEVQQTTRYLVAGS